jgi:hypothetical protein
MKVILVLLISSSNLFGQKNNITENEYNKRRMIDSLTQVIYRDTVKFDKKDLVFDIVGRRNINPYSMLYMVNGAYMYKLDIISPEQVIEFVNEFMDAEKVKGIGVIPKEKVGMIFGSHAVNGIVAILLKKKAKLNPFVAGLTKTEKKSGDNFSQRNDNEILIRY